MMASGESPSKARPEDSRGPIKVCLTCRSVFRTHRDTCPKDGTVFATSELAQGTILAGKYVVKDELGRGGMGVVYRAEHLLMGKTMALKVIHPILSTSKKFVEMFKAEARHAATFRHDNVVTVHDFGESEGRFYLVTELLEGEDLQTLLRRSGSLTPGRALKMMLQICDAVSAAHSAGILHLDLKSENVFILAGGEEDAVKVLDFGLAQPKDSATVELGDGMTIGTIGYMAPEQIMGKHVDERTDVYALGVIAYEMLAGRRPFPGESKDDILQSQLAGKTLGFAKTAVLKTVPKDTKKAIMAAFSADAAKRPSSVEELAGSFRRALDEMQGAAPAYARRHGMGRARGEGKGPTFVQKLRLVFARGKKKSAEEPLAPEGMVYVPPGEFLIGAWGGASDERPALMIPCGAFFIDITPVTNLDYAKFVQATDHRPPITWKTLSFPPGTGELPVTGITWQDAADYAAWAGKRLPTEAEWEKAARGTDGRVYPWGNGWDPAFANWGGNPRFQGGAAVQPVGSFPEDKSPYGCLDMAGNVKEWTASWYKPHGPTDFKSEDFGEKFKVVRGGSFLSSDKNYLRTTNRSHVRPEEAGDIGFRCAKDVDIRE